MNNNCENLKVTDEDCHYLQYALMTMGYTEEDAANFDQHQSGTIIHAALIAIAKVRSEYIK